MVRARSLTLGLSLRQDDALALFLTVSRLTSFSTSARDDQ